MATFLQKVTNLFKKSNIRAGSIASRNFFQDTIKKLGNPTRGAALKGAKKRSNVVIGKMYAFSYNPKYKKILPFYDRFPLIFPIKAGKNSFLGINLHYLPPKMRIVLLVKLMSLKDSRKFTTRTKLKISYNILNGIKRYQAFRPTIKRYLTSHVKSAFIEVPSEQWELVTLLPLANFKKASASQVWANSKSKI